MNVLRDIAILLFPIFVLVAGGTILLKASGRSQVQEVLRSAPVSDQKPLNRRWRGYSAAEVRQHWEPIVGNHVAIRAERRFLEWDLVFPFFYGGALAASLLLAWVTLERPFNPVWIITPVAIILLADWTENLLQLEQLHRFTEAGATAMQSGWIQVASVATVTKLVFFAGSALFLIVLFVLMLFRAKPP